VTAADGEAHSAGEWVGAGGRARVLRGATVTAAGYPVATVVCIQAKDMKQPWCLAASVTQETAWALVNLYGKRWGIEDAFRDTKDLRFGMGGAGKGSACEAGGRPAEGWAQCTSAPPTGATAYG